MPAWRVLLSPLLDFFRPLAAARSLAAARRPVFAIVILLGLVIYAALLIGLLLADGMLMEEWDSSAGTTMGSGWGGAWVAHERTAGEVWVAWHTDAPGGWLGPPTIVLALVLLLGPIALAALGWVNLPFVHGTGSVWASYRRAVRASAAVLWPLPWLTAASGGVYLAVEQARALEGIGGGVLLKDPAFWLFVCVVISLGLMVLFSRRSLLAVAPPVADPAPPLRCEGCGYDLTHRPAEHRCSECGLDLDASLIEARSRPGCAWEQRGSPGIWARTAWRVLRQPTAFYRRLKVRPVGGRELRFAAWSYLLLWCGGFAWAVALLCLASVIWGIYLYADVDYEEVVLCLCMTYTGLLGCWVGHRVTAAIVATVWLARGGLPDFRWAARVMAYESAYLFVYGVFWGLLAATFVIDDVWVSRLLGVNRAWGMPVEFLTLVFGTLTLWVVWLYRYGLAYRAIRWANF